MKTLLDGISAEQRLGKKVSLLESIGCLAAMVIIVFSIIGICSMYSTQGVYNEKQTSINF